jgi:hypothetical protein
LTEWNASGYARVAGLQEAMAAEKAGKENIFKFYQMDVTLARV